MGWPVASAKGRKSRASGRKKSRREVLLWGLVATGTMGMSSSAVARGGGRAGSFVAIDRDRDGTIDLEEAKHAAGLLFDHLDRNDTGTLTRGELGRGRSSATAFSWADRDHDGTLTKEEYLTLVERQFKAADRDHDGTVSRVEFYSRTGLPLRRLLY